MNTHPAAGWDHEDLETLAGELAIVRERLVDLRQIDASLVDAIAGKMTGQQTQAGVWRIERRKGSIRKGWDSPGLFSELITRSNHDADTGERLEPWEAREELIASVRDCVPFTASLGWRAGALRDRGIDPDEWATVIPGSWRVEVHLIEPGEVTS